MRILLAGLGEPIPGVALPDPTISSDRPPQTITYTGDDIFLKEEWVNLGYTHYEVKCIGGAGGDGGGVDLITHLLAGGVRSFGGAGGGGGFHRSSGLLSDLPDSSPVVVGQGGANGIDGNDQPLHVFDTSSSTALPNPEYIAPQAGQDGEASTFNGDACMASGGKGGLPSLIYRDIGGQVITYPQNGPGGHGGHGGVGGSTVAGGGGAGAVSELEYEGPPVSQYYVGSTLTAAEDGGWDGSIGEGGGGGRGGTYYLHEYPTHFQPPILIQSSVGGRGSFSYGDTSVYGPRGPQTTYPGPGTGTNQLIVPGAGGGTKLNKLSIYGSKAYGTPNGVVWIRIIKIV